MPFVIARGFIGGININSHINGHRMCKILGRETVLIIDKAQISPCLQRRDLF